jgi:hypothetical protein
MSSSFQDVLLDRLYDERAGLKGTRRALNYTTPIATRLQPPRKLSRVIPLTGAARLLLWARSAGAGVGRGAASEATLGVALAPRQTAEILRTQQ